MSAWERVLVTGATGLLGSHVVEQLAQRGGVVVVALVRRGSVDRNWLLQWPHVEILDGDLLEPESYRDELKRCTGVIHCAGLVGEVNRDDSYRRVNVEALKILLDHIRQSASVKRTVYVSTLGVYPLRNHFATDEQQPPADQGFDAYTSSKIEAETMARGYAKTHNLSVIILRPGFLYGPRDRTVLPKLLRFMKSGFFIYVGDKKKQLDNTYVENAAHACVLALVNKKTETGLFNVTDDPLVSKESFIQEIAKQTGLQSEFWTLPDSIARGMAYANARSPAWLAACLPPMTWERYKFLGLNLHYAIDKAKSELGYRPLFSFEDGMAKSIAWFRSEGLF